MTDDEGRFEVSDLAPGQYTVMALSPDDSHPGDGDSSSIPLAWDDPPPVRKVFLKAGEVRELELVGRPRYGRVFGTVLRDGVPVPGAFVNADDRKALFIADAGRRGPGATTDDEGRYSLRVPQGEWSVFAMSLTAEGGLEQVLGSVRASVESGKSTEATIRVPLSDSDSE
jgi:hypothetical protein